MVVMEKKAKGKIIFLPSTCKTCRKRYHCLEYTRWYPCRDYEREVKRHVRVESKQKRQLLPDLPSDTAAAAGRTNAQRRAGDKRTICDRRGGTGGSR